MKEKIEEIRKSAKEELSKIQNLQELQELRVKYLGKKSELTAVLKGLGSLSAEERPKIGSMVNELRKEIESTILETEVNLKEKELKKQL